LNKETHVGDALNRDALKIMLVQLLDSRLEVGGGLVLNEALATRAGGVALAVDLTIDNVKARLAGEVLEILGLKSVDASGALKEHDRIHAARYVPAS
jgi:hypothetical protein